MEMKKIVSREPVLFPVFAWKITTIKKLLNNNNKIFEGLISKDQK